jgi:hypothetical protein
MSITLAELKIQSRDRSDMAESEFVGDSELTSYINNSIAELHDILIGAYAEEYYMESEQFSAVDSQLDYALPEDFYKLRGVDVRINNDAWVTVKRFNFNRRNEDANNFAWNLLGVPYLEYRLVGSNIRFNRNPSAGSEFRIWYYPRAQTLSADSDVFDDINGFAEYVIVDAAIKMMQKEESDVSVLMAQKEALKKRIQEMAQNRDANEPESVTDIYAEDVDFYVFGRK